MRADDVGHLNLEGKRTLFVAATGGHLAQLHRFAQRMNASEDSAWLTFRSPQSESLLANADVTFVPYVAPRDYRGTLASTRTVSRLLEEKQIQAVVSTGAAIALGAFIPARYRRVPSYYIESVSRVHGPSLTGRLTAKLRLANTFTQHPHWSDERWQTHASVLSAYKRVRRDRPQDGSLLVTLGTIRPYRFDRLVDMIVRGGAAGSDTIWQLGATSRTGLPGTAHELLDAREFAESAEMASAVVTHAGVGTILGLLEMGVLPIVVPRYAQLGEHVDDHQLQICELLERTGVGIVVRDGAIGPDVLAQAAGWKVEPR